MLNKTNTKKGESMTKDKNILKAIQPIKMFYVFYGKYPTQEAIRSVCNINNKQYKEALKLAKERS